MSISVPLHAEDYGRACHILSPSLYCPAVIVFCIEQLGSPPMLSKKNPLLNEPVDRLRALLSQLKTARLDSDDLSRQARDEVGQAIRGTGLKPVRGAGAVRARKKKAAKKTARKKKAGRKKR